MNITGTGSYKAKPSCSNDEIPFCDVQVLPDLSVNLLSVNQIVRKGYIVVFNNDGCKVIDKDGDVVATGSHENDLFKLQECKQGKKNTLAVSSTGSLELWHQRMGHLDINGVRSLAKVQPR